MIDGNYMIDGDMGYDCDSPYHDDSNCHACQEAKRYANANYCPMCYCYTIEGQEVEAPELADVREEVCERCKELEGEV